MRTACLVVLAACGGGSASHRPTYPEAKRGDVVETHGATKIADPYRWLEEMESADTKAWVAAENQLTDAALATWPSRATLRTRLTELMGQERTFPPRAPRRPLLLAAQRRSARPALRDDGDLARRARHGPPRREHAGRARQDLVCRASLSRDGKLLAYGTAEGGGDWHVWRFRDVDTGKDLPDQLANIKYYEPVIVPGGVYYSAFPTPPKGQELTVSDHDCKVFFHKLGTPASAGQGGLRAPRSAELAVQARDDQRRSTRDHLDRRWRGRRQPQVSARRAPGREQRGQGDRGSLRERVPVPR